MSKTFEEPTEIETAKSLRAAAAGLKKWLTDDYDTAIRTVMRGNPIASLSALFAIAATFAQRAGEPEAVNDFLNDFILEQTDRIKELQQEADTDD